MGNDSSPRRHRAEHEGICLCSSRGRLCLYVLQGGKTDEQEKENRQVLRQGAEKAAVRDDKIAAYSLRQPTPLRRFSKISTQQSMDSMRNTSP